MSIIFYDHIIDKTDLDTYLNNLEAPPENKNKIKAMADDILHAGILEFILQKLHPHHHHTFLNRVEQVPYDPELIQYLKDHIDDQIELEIQKEANRLKKLILKDLKNP